MFKKIFFLAFLFLQFNSFSQVFINEVDADTPSTDVLEFIELKSTVPNFSLNGYVLVFFNGLTSGTGIQSYYALDLDGFSTDVNGIFHLGNSGVSPTPSATFPSVTMQNGPDGIAIYQANATDFPNATNATSTNLISGFSYTNNATNTTALNSIFGLSNSINENQTSLAPTVSMQRKNDGSFELKTPTPGFNNDGTGIVLNGIITTVSPIGNLTEGSNFTITFTTQQPVTTTILVFSYSIANANFDIFDYTGNLSVIMPVGTNTITKNFTLNDDTLIEGDETMLISIGVIPTGYSTILNNIPVRIHDNDNIVRNFGNPLLPTFGNVANTAPANYYSSLDGLSGNALKTALQNIIANPLLVREHSYGDVNDVLKIADENPANSSQVWLMYVEQPRSKLDIQTNTSGAAGFWNREHIYPQSRGGFSDATSSTPDGINTYILSNANRIESGHSDMHHIRAEDSPENSLRSNRNYGVDYNGPYGSGNSWKGDVARAVFYMAVRYNSLNVVNGNVSESPAGNIGDLATLLAWHTLDPADDFEMNRNNVIYNWQINRNPFIDNPSLVSYIFGSNFGQPWAVTLNTKTFENYSLQLFPNPNTNQFQISGLKNNAIIEIYNTTGNLVYQNKVSNSEIILTQLATGIYFATIIEEGFTTKKKIIIR